MKAFLHLFMALLLSFSLLAPALLTLATGQPIIQLSQNNEEENETQSNNLLEEIKEKKLIISDFIVGEAIYTILQRKNSFYYTGNTLDSESSIFLPPPEQA